jgi:hypothetical protein
MLRKTWSALRPAVFWSYRRGSWQYDIMVGLILAFVFLTPRSWFRDQPRAQQIVMLPAADGHSVFWIDPDLVGNLPPEKLEPQIRVLLEKRTGKRVGLLKVEPAQDAEGQLKGYVVHARL